MAAKRFMAAMPGGPTQRSIATAAVVTVAIAAAMVLAPEEEFDDLDCQNQIFQDDPYCSCVHCVDEKHVDKK